MPVLETPRLILKPHTLANAERLNAWSNDPELLYYDDDLPEPYRVSPIERTIAFIEKNAKHDPEGEVVHWAIHLKVDGEQLTVDGQEPSRDEGTEGQRDETAEVGGSRLTVDGPESDGHSLVDGGRLQGVAGRGSQVADPEAEIDNRQPSTANREPSLFIGYCMAAFIDRYHRKCKFGITIGDKSQWGKGYAREAITAVLRYLFETLEMNRVQCEIYDFNERSIRLFESLGFVREGVCRQSVLKKGRFADEYVYGMLRSDWAENAGKPGLSQES